MPRKPPDESRKPLSLAVLHILLALSDGAAHGYAIKQAVEQRTGGAIRLGPGTLYEAIQRLQEAGIIGESADHGVEAANGQQAQRRYYALTDKGWDTLRDELRQLHAVIDLARANPRLRKGLT